MNWVRKKGDNRNCSLFCKFVTMYKGQSFTLRVICKYITHFVGYEVKSQGEDIPLGRETKTNGTSAFRYPSFTLYGCFLCRYQRIKKALQTLKV